MDTRETEIIRSGIAIASMGVFFFFTVDDIMERQNKIRYPSTSDACDIRTCTDHRRGRGHWLHISNGRRLLQIQNKSDLTNSGAR